MAKTTLPILGYNLDKTSKNPLQLQLQGVFYLSGTMFYLERNSRPNGDISRNR